VTDSSSLVKKKSFANEPNPENRNPSLADRNTITQEPFLETLDT